MKLMMFAALAAAVAMPALAQTTPAPGTPDAQTAPATATPPPAADPAPQPTPPADPAAQPAPTPDASASAAAPTPATGSYPKCSRSVTDQCTESSNGKGERKHAPRHKK